MKDNDKPYNHLDAAIESIKADKPSKSNILAAENRVQQLITSKLNSQEDQSSAEIQFNSTEQYIAAIPDYLANRLSDQQVLLFEEESRCSIPLRKALNAARKKEEAVKEYHKHQNMPSITRWFARAAIVAVIAVAVTMVAPRLPTFNQSHLAQVENIEGELYQVSDGRLSVLTQGLWVNGRQDIRTSNNGRALLVLDDGSRIEVNERTELSISRHHFGNRIEVERGRILVEASAQGSGALEVITNELQVSVVGTIFEVGHGAMGSRVAVIEGEVQVTQMGNTEDLLPGEQINSRSTAVAKTINEEIAWSRDADRYIEMLSALSDLKKDLDAALDIEPRYSMRLLNLAPQDTVVYIAVPNAPEKISEVYRLLHSHMEKLEGTQDVIINMQQTGDAKQLNEFMQWLDEIGDVLGDETVAAVSMRETADGFHLMPLVLSEVNAEAFSESFEHQLQKIQSVSSKENQPNKINVSLVAHPNDARSGEVSIWLYEDILVASTEPALIKSIQGVLEQGQNEFVNSGFYQLLRDSYSNGTEFLGAAYLAKIMSAVKKQDGLDSKVALNMTGLNNAQYLLAERRQLEGRGTMAAELLFDGERSGMMSWLANPSPMTSLEFFSVYSNSVISAVFKDPESIASEAEKMIRDAAIAHNADHDIEFKFPINENNDDGFQKGLLETIRNDIIKSLGGEFAFGLDGPLLPNPSWKLVFEAYDSQLLQESIENIIKQINDKIQANGNAYSIVMDKLDFGSYSGYRVQANGFDQDGFDGHFKSTGLKTIFYAYIDGYMVLAPSEVQIVNAIKYYQTGSNILTDNEFKSLLPNDGQLDFSAVAFNRIGKLVSKFIDKLPSTLSEEQKSMVKQLNKNTSLLYSITVNHNGFRFVQNGNTELPFTIVELLSLQSILKDSLQQTPMNRLQESTNI